jgi:ATP synthase protein I
MESHPQCHADAASGIDVAAAKIHLFDPDFNNLSAGRRLLTQGYPISMVRAALKGAGGFFARFLRAVMNNDARETDGPNDKPTDEAALSARLRQLGDRLGQQQASQPPKSVAPPSAANNASAMARGFRLSSELVAGVLVGGVIGWALDKALGISPWGFIVFLLLGFAAGVLNVMRAAGVVAEQDDRK